MTIQITYKNTSLKKISSNFIQFVDDKFNISSIKKNISNKEYLYILDLLKTSDLKKDILFFKINSKKTIYLISIKRDKKANDLEDLGAKFFDLIKNEKQNEFYLNSELTNKIINFYIYFLHGLRLKSYKFIKRQGKKIKKVSNFVFLTYKCWYT